MSNLFEQPSWLPQGQKEIGDRLNALTKLWSEGKLLSVMLIAELVDDHASFACLATEPENPFAMMGYLTFMANFIAHDIGFEGYALEEEGGDGDVHPHSD